ncbi:DUF305 domain-containing protein [Nocardia sp. GCM10030253]|uniref:DUF305 domain-containing protein n=1 Tax=Nocardia sp. GCM10030253 TaxID=3273404 RepID=UPI00362EE787
MTSLTKIDFSIKMNLCEDLSPQVRGLFFLQLRIRHHRGGVGMAQAAFNTGSAAAATRQALEIVNEQGNEIGPMTAMLTAMRAQPLPFP